MRWGSGVATHGFAAVKLGPVLLPPVCSGATSAVCSHVRVCRAACHRTLTPERGDSSGGRAGDRRAEVADAATLDIRSAGIESDHPHLCRRLKHVKSGTAFASLTGKRANLPPPVIPSDAPLGGGAESKDVVAAGNDDRANLFPVRQQRPETAPPQFRTPNSELSPLRELRPPRRDPSTHSVRSG